MLLTYNFKSGIWLEVAMCGRFAQSQTREEYLAYLTNETEHDIAFDPKPIGSYNVAQGLKFCF